MDITRASIVAALALLLLVGIPAELLAQNKSESGKPTVRRRRVPVAQAADPAYTPALAEAESALEKKDHARAETLLKQVIAQNDKNYRAWFDLGTLYAATDRKPEAVSALQKSVNAKPDVFESNLNLGLLLASTGRNQEAAAQLRKATTLKPSNRQTAQQGLAHAWSSLGQVLEQDQPAEALAAFRAAAQLVPQDAQPHLEAAQILEKTKDYKQAEGEYQQALSLKPNLAEALTGLVNVLITQKKFDEAEGILRKLVAADPQNRAARLQLGRLQVANQHYDDAIGEFNQILQFAPADRQAKRELAGAAANAKKYDLAEKNYRELIQAEPEHAETRFALGTLLMNQRKFPEAEAELLQTVRLDPKLADAYGNLAVVASENRHYELALKALEVRARFVPDNPGTYFLRATCYDHLKDLKQASENYRKFLEVAEGKFPTQEWQARHRLVAIEPKK